MAAELRRELRAVRDTLLAEPVSPRVDEPADINRHYCQYVAETVVERLGDDVDVEVLQDGGRGYVHTWLGHDGRHYDAECVDGVADYRALPFFRRHPEAAMHIEPASTDPARLRQRGREPLYPDILDVGGPDASGRRPPVRYWKHAAAGVLLGALLTLIGLSGEWALHEQLLEQSAALRMLLIDLEILGELLLLVSPIVFLILLPSQRAAARRRLE